MQREFHPSPFGVPRRETGIAPRNGKPRKPDPRRRGLSMPFLIDGHNLIGAFPGLNLSDPEDERQLLGILEEYGRLSRRKFVVYFDRGQTGMGPLSTSGRMVKAHFIPPPRRADDAILDFLHGRKDASHFTVVSSDSEVCVRARRSGAKVISAEQFVRELQAPLEADRTEKPSGNPDEIEDWLRLFEKKP
jgi:predicted RNA-binding protein with PIN domain